MNASTVESKPRIEWIDTAKGICISLVVLSHLAIYLHTDYPLSDVLMTFRMPLYFVLSGLFFKTYGGGINLTIKKINKLLIPYVFWYIILSIVAPYLLYVLFNIIITPYGNEPQISDIKYIFSEQVVTNSQIWFLFSLFEINIIFFILFKIAVRFKHEHIAVVLFSLLFGFIGLATSVWYKLPYYLDTSLSALPFFVFGWFVKQHNTEYLTKKPMKLVSLCLLFIGFISLTHFVNGGPAYFRNNLYGTKLGYMLLYPYGLLGTLMVFEISRKLGGHIPILSHIGRYSIIVLITHGYVIKAIIPVCSFVTSNVMIELIIGLVLVIILCYILINPVRNYLGYFTAQKDLIKIK